MKPIGLFVFILLAVSAGLIHAQVSFQKRIDIESWARAYSIGETPDAGFLITGFTSVNALGMAKDTPYALRITPEGGVAWIHSFGLLNGYGYMRSFLFTDGSFIIILEDAFAENSQFIKCDPSGKVLWSKSYAGSVNAIAGSDNRSFALAGYAGLISFLDSNGVLIWSQTIGAPTMTTAALIQTTGNGYALVQGKPDDGGIWLTQLSAQGQIQWTKYFSAPNQKFIPQGILLSSDNGLVIAGGIETDSTGRDTDIAIIKFNSTGGLLWSKEIGMFRNAMATSITETNDGDLVITGYSSSSFRSPGASNDSIIMADITQIGVMKYAAILGLSGMSARASASTRTTGNTFAILGNMRQDFKSDTPVNSIFIAKHLANSNDNCNLRIAPFSIKDVGSVIDSVLSAQKASPTISSGAAFAMPLTMYNTSDLCSNSFISALAEPSFSLSLSPNPLHSSEPLTIHPDNLPQGKYDLRISNLLGNVLIKKKINLEGVQDISLDVSRLGSGAFIVEMQIENESGKIYRAKFVKE